MSISTRNVFLATALSFALLFTIALPAAAQNRAIKGKITDPDGQPIPDVQITIQGTDIARVLKTKTNDKGEYMYLLGMQVGTYRVIARKKGFQPDYKLNIRPEIGIEEEVDFTLAPGEDYKLPFEMTAEEMEKYREQLEAQKKRMKFSEAVKNHFNAGVELSEQGMYTEAIEEFKQAHELDREQPAIIARMADAYAQLGNNDEALANYQQAIELSPNDPNLYTNLGVVLSKMGKTDESQVAFKKAAEMSPGSAAKNYYNLGVTMVNNGNMAEAVEAFKKALEADPGYSEAYYQLGMALSGSQDTIPDAIEALKKYLDIGQKPEQIEIAKQIIAALEGQ
jgi:tetratricopeptide (TPR) repeat protein